MFRLIGLYSVNEVKYSSSNTSRGSAQGDGKPEHQGQLENHIADLRALQADPQEDLFANEPLAAYNLPFGK